MKEKEFAVYLRNQSMVAVRAAQGKRFIMAAVVRDKMVVTDLAQELSFGTVILIMIGPESAVAGTTGSFGNVTSERRLKDLSSFP